MRKTTCIVFLITLVITFAWPDISDSTWNALIGKMVLIDKVDGQKVEGEVLIVQADSVSISTVDGILEISREEIKAVILKKPAETHEASVASLGPPMPGSYISIDPLGILQVGPGVELGLRILPDLYLVPRFRWSYLGLLYNEIVQALTDGTSDLTPANFALGTSITRFFPGTATGRWYVGTSLDFFLTDQDIDAGSSEERHSSAQTLLFMGEFGYRWTARNSFYICLGGQAGIGFALSSKWWYVDTPDEKFDADIGDMPMGMLQLRLGWELPIRAKASGTASAP